MATDPRIVALADDLYDTLAAMTRAEGGYWYDYGDVVWDAAADWDADKDPSRPRRFLLWDGELSEDPVYGSEAPRGGAPNRFRRWFQFIVTIAVKDSVRPSLVAWRMAADHHKAVISTNRVRGGTRVLTSDAGIMWEPIYEGGKPLGGILGLTYVIRWDHITGDMTSQ